MEKKKIDSRSIRSWMVDNTALLGLIVVLIAGTCINARSFLSLQNLFNVGRQATVRGLMACGVSMVIICGSYDLSVSANYAFSCYLSLVMAQYSIVLAFAVPLIVGAVVGLVNAIMICKWRFPSWIATIAMQYFLSGLLLQLVHGETYKPAISNPAFYAFGNFSLKYVNTYILVFVFVYLLFSYLMKSKSAFRNMYAVGGNAEAAKMMGVSVFKTRALAHCISGVLSALAGILLGARTGSAYPVAGQSYEMYAIAASVLGGIYLKGGRGKLMGTFVGAWILGILNNLFNMQNSVDPLWEQVLTGMVIIVVVIVQSLNANQKIRAKAVKA